MLSKDDVFKSVSNRYHSSDLCIVSSTTTDTIRLYGMLLYINEQPTEHTDDVRSRPVSLILGYHRVNRPNVTYTVHGHRYAPNSRPTKLTWTSVNTLRRMAAPLPLQDAVTRHIRRSTHVRPSGLLANLLTPTRPASGSAPISRTRHPLNLVSIEHLTDHFGCEFRDAYRENDITLLISRCPHLATPHSRASQLPAIQPRDEPTIGEPRDLMEEDTPSSDDFPTVDVLDESPNQRQLMSLSPVDDPHLRCYNDLFGTVDTSIYEDIYALLLDSAYQSRPEEITHSRLISLLEVISLTAISDQAETMPRRRRPSLTDCRQQANVVSLHETLRLLVSMHEVYQLQNFMNQMTHQCEQTFGSCIMNHILDIPENEFQFRTLVQCTAKLYINNTMSSSTAPYAFLDFLRKLQNPLSLAHVVHNIMVLPDPRPEFTRQT
jgi:hypothetical protein